MDFGTLGEVLGDDFGDLDVDFKSAGFEVGGGVPGSEADFSVSFYNKQKHKKVQCLALNCEIFLGKTCLHLLNFGHANLAKGKRLTV